jgi:hypothetical protein
VPAIADDDLRRLDVGMRDASDLRGVQRAGDLDAQFEQESERNRLSADFFLALCSLRHCAVMKNSVCY